MGKTVKKLISILTTLSFLLSVFGLDTAKAAESLVIGSGNIKDIEKLSGFISSDLGRVFESNHYENSKYTIINIQDLHCNEEVQKNISLIIDNLQKQYEISSIFVEGGYGKIDTSVFEAIEDGYLKDSIIKGMLENGRLTGTEYFLLKNKVGIPVYGLENESVHKQNLARLAGALNNRQHYAEVLLEIKKEIDYLQSKYLSRENKKFNRMIEEYKSGRIKPERYYALLAKYINKINSGNDKYNSFLYISQDRYPVFKLYGTLLNSSGKIDYKKASYEMKRIIDSLKDKLPYSEYNALSLKTAGFTNIEELGLSLNEISKKYGIHIDENSSFAQFVRYIESSKAVNPVALIDEERKIAEDIRVAFSRNDTEIEISFLGDFYSYLEAFLNTRIISGDYDFFEAEYDRFERVYSKHSYGNGLSALKDDIKFLKEYYGVNKNRNHIFADNIGKYADLGKTAIVVTGGFHSEGLNKLFKQDKISYISVLPSITKETKTSERNYDNIVMESSVFASQTIALGLASQATYAEIANMMIDAATAELAGLEYSRERIEELVRVMSESLKEKVSLDFNENRAEIRVSNGQVILLENKSGKLVNSTKANAKAIRNNRGLTGGQLTNLQEAAFGTALAGHKFAFSPNAYGKIKNIMSFAAKNNLISGDGLIFGIEMDARTGDQIDGIDKELLAKMPDYVQEAVLRFQNRTEQASVAASKNVLMRALLTAYYKSELDTSVLDYLFAKPGQDDGANPYSAYLRSDEEDSGGDRSWELLKAIFGDSPEFRSLAETPKEKIFFNEKGEIVFSDSAQELNLSRVALSLSGLHHDVFTGNKRLMLLSYYVSTDMNLKDKHGALQRKTFVYGRKGLSAFKEQFIETLSGNNASDYTMLSDSLELLQKRNNVNAETVKKQNEAFEKITSYIKNNLSNDKIFDVKTEEHWLFMKAFDGFFRNYDYYEANKLAELPRSLLPVKVHKKMHYPYPYLSLFTGEEAGTFFSAISKYYEIYGKAESEWKTDISNRIFRYLSNISSEAELSDRFSIIIKSDFEKMLAGINNLYEDSKQNSASAGYYDNAMSTMVVELDELFKFFGNSMFVDGEGFPDEKALADYLQTLAKKAEAKSVVSEIIMGILGSMKNMLYADVISDICPAEHRDYALKAMEEGRLEELFEFAAKNNLQDLMYFTIEQYTKYSTGYRFFAEIYSDKNIDTEIRIFALLRGAVEYGDDENIMPQIHEAMKDLSGAARKMLEDMLKDGKKSTDSINNNFWNKNEKLSVYSFAVLLEILKNTGLSENSVDYGFFLYIASAKIFPFYRNANAALEIGDEYLETPEKFIATLFHELGHGINTRSIVQSIKNPAVNEMFADAVMMYGMQKLNGHYGYGSQRIADAYKKLEKINFDSREKEEHLLGRGFLKLLIGANKEVFGGRFDFNMLSKAILTVVSGAQNITYYEFCTSLIKEYLKAKTGFEVNLSFILIDRLFPEKSKVTEAFKKAKNKDGSLITDISRRGPAADSAINADFLRFCEEIKRNNDIKHFINYVTAALKGDSKKIEYLVPLHLNLAGEEIVSIYSYNHLNELEIVNMEKADMALPFYIVVDDKIVKGFNYGEKITLGRDEGCVYSEGLQHMAMISRNHISIEISDDRIVNLDDTSTNGTVVEYAVNDVADTDSELPKFESDYRQISLFSGGVLGERNELLKEKPANAVSEKEYAGLMNMLNWEVADSLNSFTRDDLRTSYSKAEIPYLEVIRIRNNNALLIEYIENTGDLHLKLFALMYLRINGYDGYGADGILRYFENSILSGQFRIENDFDLRAALTGYNLIVIDVMRKDTGKNFDFLTEDSVSIHNGINRALFVRRWTPVFSADVDMISANADNLDRITNIINSNISRINFYDGAIEKLWREQTTPGSSEVNVTEDETEKFISVERILGVGGREDYVATTETYDEIYVTQEVYEAYQKKRDAELEEAIAADIEELNKAAEVSSKAEQAAIRKKVMNAAYKTSTLNVYDGEIRVKLPSGETMLFKKRFNHDNTGICSMELLNDRGNTVKREVETFYNPHDIKGLERYNRKRFAVKAMELVFSRSAYGQSVVESRLELPNVKKIADKLHLKGWPRYIFVGMAEYVFTVTRSAEKFADMHYKSVTGEIRNSDIYKARTQGAKDIQKATVIGLVLGIAAAVSVPLFGISVSAGAIFALALAPQFIFNVLSHAYYDVKVEKEVELEKIRNGIFFGGQWKNFDSDTDFRENLNNLLARLDINAADSRKIAESFMSVFGANMEQLRRMESRYPLFVRNAAEKLYALGISEGLSDVVALEKRIALLGYNDLESRFISRHFNLYLQTLVFEESAGITYKTDEERAGYMQMLNVEIEERREALGNLNRADNLVDSGVNIKRIAEKIFFSGTWNAVADSENLNDDKNFNSLLLSLGYSQAEVKQIKDEYFMTFGDSAQSRRRMTDRYPFRVRAEAEIIVEKGLIGILVPQMAERESALYPNVPSMRYTSAMAVVDALKELGYREGEADAIAKHIYYDRNNSKAFLSLSDNGGYLETSSQAQRIFKESAKKAWQAETSAVEGRLELPRVKAIADKLRLKGWIRHIFVGMLEYVFTVICSSEKFVNMHYESVTEDIKNSDIYKARMQGANKIRKATLIGAILGVAAVVSIPFLGIPVTLAGAIALLFAPQFVFNVLTHALYNGSVPEEYRLNMWDPVRKISLRLNRNPAVTVNYKKDFKIEYGKSSVTVKKNEEGEFFVEIDGKDYALPIGGQEIVLRSIDKKKSADLYIKCLEDGRIEIVNLPVGRNKETIAIEEAGVENVSEKRSFAYSMSNESAVNQMRLFAPLQYFQLLASFKDISFNETENKLLSFDEGIFNAIETALSGGLARPELKNALSAIQEYVKNKDSAKLNDVLAEEFAAPERYYEIMLILSGTSEVEIREELEEALRNRSDSVQNTAAALDLFGIINSGESNAVNYPFFEILRHSGIPVSQYRLFKSKFADNRESHTEITASIMPVSVMRADGKQIYICDREQLQAVLKGENQEGYENLDKMRSPFVIFDDNGNLMELQETKGIMFFEGDEIIADHDNEDAGPDSFSIEAPERKEKIKIKILNPGSEIRVSGNVSIDEFKRSKFTFLNTKQFDENEIYAQHKDYFDTSREKRESQAFADSLKRGFAEKRIPEKLSVVKTGVDLSFLSKLLSRGEVNPVIASFTTKIEVSAGVHEEVQVNVTLFELIDILFNENNQIESNLKNKLGFIRVACLNDEERAKMLAFVIKFLNKNAQGFSVETPLGLSHQYEGRRKMRITMTPSQSRMKILSDLSGEKQLAVLQANIENALHFCSEQIHDGIGADRGSFRVFSGRKYAKRKVFENLHDYYVARIELPNKKDGGNSKYLAYNIGGDFLLVAVNSSGLGSVEGEEIERAAGFLPENNEAILYKYFYNDMDKWIGQIKRSHGAILQLRRTMESGADIEQEITRRLEILNIQLSRVEVFRKLVSNTSKKEAIYLDIILEDALFLFKSISGDKIDNLENINTLGAFFEAVDAQSADVSPVLKNPEIRNALTLHRRGERKKALEELRDNGSTKLLYDSLLNVVSGYYSPRIEEMLSQIKAVYTIQELLYNKGTNIKAYPSNILPERNYILQKNNSHTSFSGLPGSAVFNQTKIFKKGSPKLPGGNLTLPATEKRVRELNLSGWKKYIYISIVELPVMFFSTPKRFAHMHKKEDRASVLKSARRIAVAQSSISAIITGVAILATSAFVFPVLLGFVSMFAVNMILHGIHNYRVDKQRQENLKTFPESKIEELGKMIKHYYAADNKYIFNYIESDIDYLFAENDEIENLFTDPYGYVNGMEIKEKYVQLLEVLYYLALSAEDTELQYKMLDVVSPLYTYMDSVRIQASVIQNAGFMDVALSDLYNSSFYEVLTGYFYENLEYFSFVDVNDYKAFDAARMQNTKDIALFLIANSQSHDLNPEDFFKDYVIREKYGKIAAQIMLDAYKTFYDIDLKEFLGKFFSKRKAEKVKNFFESAENIDVLSEIVKQEKLPKQLVYFYLYNYMSAREIYEVLMDENQDIELRMLALNSIAAMPFSSNSLYSHITEQYRYMGALSDFDTEESSYSELSESFNEINKDRKPLFGRQTYDELYSKIKEYLDSVINIGSDIQDEGENLFMPSRSDIYKSMAAIYSAGEMFNANQNLVIEQLRKFPKYVNYKNIEMSSIHIDHIMGYEGSVTKINNTEYFKSLSKILYGNERSPETFISDFLVSEAENRKLPFAQRIANKLNLHGWTRAVVVALLGFPVTFLSVSYFADMCYKNGNIDESATQSEGYQVRVKGAENVKSGTVVGAALGVATAFVATFFLTGGAAVTITTIATAAITALLGGVSVNIYRRASHNMENPLYPLETSSRFGEVSAYYKFVKERILLANVSGYSIEKKGNAITVPVMVINNMPANPKEFDFKNTGIKISGKSVWISAKSKALVIFAENSDFKEIESAMKNDIKKIRLQLSKLIKRNMNISLNSSKLSIDWVNIENSDVSSMEYDDDGAVRVKLHSDETNAAGDIAGYMTGIRDVRNADMNAAVQNIYYFLDNVTNNKDLLLCLHDFEKIGNGQIIIDYGVLRRNLGAGEMEKFFAAAHRSGVKIIADNAEGNLSAQNMIRTGFDGYLHRDNRGNLYIHDFALATDINANMVEGFNNSDTLFEKLRDTQNIKIIKNSEIVKNLSGDDRSILDRTGFLRILKGINILGALKKDMNNEEFIANAAYALKSGAIPDMNGVSDEQLASMLQKEDISGIVKAMRLSDSHPIAIYLNKIAHNVEDKSRVGVLQRKFLESIAERVLIARTVAGELVNKDMEKTLGKALIAKAVFKTFGNNDDSVKISEQEFKKRYSGDFLQNELKKEAGNLAAEAFKNKNVVAVNTLIELIPAIAEVKFRINVDKNSIAQFDVREMKNLLSAA